MSDQELEPAKDGTHSNLALMREDIPELVQLIVREVAKNMGTGSGRSRTPMTFRRALPGRKMTKVSWLGLVVCSPSGAFASIDVVW